MPRPDVMRWKYTKLLMNLANSVEATVAPDPRVGELVKLVRAEGEACLRAAGIDFASREEDKERRGDRMHVRPVNGEFRGGGSSWQSLARGTGSIETDYLNGEIVLLGRDPRRADPGERAHAANRESLGARRARAEIDPGRDAPRATRSRFGRLRSVAWLRV